MLILAECELKNPKIAARIKDDKYHMTPAEYVIFIFGGVNKTSRIFGRHRSSVSRWQDPKRGLSGRVPLHLAPIILEQAQKDGLDLVAEDLLVGRCVKVRIE